MKSQKGKGKNSRWEFVVKESMTQRPFRNLKNLLAYKREHKSSREGRKDS